MRPAMLLRQSEIIHEDVLSERIHIIGAGAIGSFTALALSKMGFQNISVWDDDQIEEENMNCQFYPIDSIGSPKTEALKSMVKSFSGTDISDNKKKYEGGALHGFVISAVDNMKTRKFIWEQAKESAVTQWFIDPRMGAEVALLYVMNPHDEKDISCYEKTLYSDEDSVQERCTAKATMYTVLLLSGLISKAVKDLVTGAKPTRIIQWDIGQNAAMGLEGANQ